MRSAATVAILSCVLLSCYARSKELPEPCSANDVLRLIGTALASGDASVLRPVILRADDLFPQNGDSNRVGAQQRKNFDSESLQNVVTAVNALVPRYRGARVQRVQMGTIDRRVTVEGMDIVIDRMKDGSIVFERDGRETTFSVADLISPNGCWKIEHLGTGVAEPAHDVPHARSLRPPGGTGFRRFANDFCTGLSVYSTPNDGSKIGSLIEGYRKYRDPQTKRVYEAVLLQSLATGHVRGVWLNLEQLANTFVDRSDHALQDCKWSTREEEVSPLPEESPAAVPRHGK